MSEWESDEFGAMILHEKPVTRLVDAPAFALPEGATLQQFEVLADWIRVRGGLVPYVDEYGLLVVSIYRDEFGEPTGERYYEFIQPSALVAFDPRHGEFTSYGHSMLQNYTIERLGDSV